MQLVGEFSHKSKTQGTYRNFIINGKFTIPDKRKCFIGHIRVSDFFKYLTCIWSSQIDDPKCIGEVDHMKVPAVITCVIAEPLDCVAGTAGGGGKIVIVFAPFYHHAVINNTAVVIAHSRVFNLAVRNL